MTYGMLEIPNSDARLTTSLMTTPNSHMYRREAVKVFAFSFEKVRPRVDKKSARKYLHRSNFR